MEVQIKNWGNVNPVQFTRAVTPQMANDLAEAVRIVRRVRGEMQERRGGNDGRDFTECEADVYELLGKAAQPLGYSVLSASNTQSEDVTLPAMHDGGPDMEDGAPTDGHVSDGVLV